MNQLERRTVLTLLDAFWSPLPRHADEMKPYVAHVLHLAKTGTPEALRAHLSRVRTNDMGAPPNAELDRQVADVLVETFGDGR